MKTITIYTALMYVVLLSGLNSYGQIYNYFAGSYAGSGNTGSYCVGLGVECMGNGNKGNYNSALGYATLLRNTTGVNNTALGYRSLNYNSIGSNNTGIGYQSLYSNTTGKSNVANGSNSLYRNTFGSYNVANGQLSLYFNDGGLGNTANGYQTLYKNTSGSYNTASGYLSLYSNITGFYNVANGNKALYSNATGFSNTAMGDMALYSHTVGSYNTAVGRNAGYLQSSNNRCTYIGSSADATIISGLINATAIGYAAKVTASNQVRIGNTSVTSIGGQVSWSTLSDKRFKKDLKENVPGLDFINKLKPLTYHIDVTGILNSLKGKKINIEAGADNETPGDNSIFEKEKSVYTGFAAQDVEKAAKEIGYDFSGVDAPKNESDYYGLRYAEFVVPLVKAVQELSTKNDDLIAKETAQEKHIHDLEQRIEKLETLMKLLPQTNDQKTRILSYSYLEQNVPNPFNSITTISYTLPDKYALAKITITDKSGRSIKEVNISGNGKGSLKIDAATLSSGAYYYSLYVNGKIIDTKQMLQAR